MSSGNLQKLISSFLASVQTLEDSTNDVYQSRFIDQAEGVNLDGLGAMVGEERLGLDDAAYRITIRTRIRVNLSSGTVADLQAVFAAALGTGYTLEISQGAVSAEFEARLTPDIDASQRDRLRALLQTAKGAGIYAYLVTTTGNGFRFAGGSGPARGFGVGAFNGAG